MSLVFLQQQIQEVFKNQQEQLSMQLLQQKNAGIVSQEVSFHFLFTFFLLLSVREPGLLGGKLTVKYLLEKKSYMFSPP